MILIDNIKSNRQILKFLFFGGGVFNTPGPTVPLDLEPSGTLSRGFQKQPGGSKIFWNLEPPGISSVSAPV